MSNWDDEDFQPAVAVVAVPKVVDKWEGEDEEEEIKESWEEIGEEEKKPEASGDVQAAPKAEKKKKKLAEILAEKEKKKLEEKGRKKESQELQERRLTEAERIALEEERELEIAKETFGIDTEASGGSWDQPLNTEQDLKAFREALVAKLEKQKAPVSVYVTFLEDFLRDVCVGLQTDDVKKLSATVNAIHNEKVNAAKAGGKAKKGKKAGRANLNVGAKNAQDDDAFYGTAHDDYDDFI